MDRDMFMVNVTPVTVVPAGSPAAMSKPIRPRRMSPARVFPEKTHWPAPLLSGALRVSYRVSSLLAPSNAVATTFQISPQLEYTEASPALCRFSAKLPAVRESRVASTVVTDAPPAMLVRGWTTPPRSVQLPA